MAILTSCIVLRLLGMIAVDFIQITPSFKQNMTCLLGFYKILMASCNVMFVDIYMLNKNSLAVKKVRGQSEATNISDQKL